MWDENNVRVADIQKIEKVIRKMKTYSVIRLGGMTDCFQPLEAKQKVALETIKILNEYRIQYLIVTKSSMIAADEYIRTMDKDLAHIQVSVTCLDDMKYKKIESACPPSKRIKAIMDLQSEGYDAAIRLSPLMEEYMDFEKLNTLNINKCIIEFLRINAWIKKWLPEVNCEKYTLKQNNYYHLPLTEKIKLINRIRIANKTVCEDVTEHYAYWKDNVNPNKLDCCNLENKFE